MKTKHENKTITFASVITELQRSYDFFVNHFSLDKDKYSNALITVMAAGRRQALGWHIEGGWEGKDKIKRTEINLSAEHLNRPVTELLGTLLHEMAHLKNSTEGIDDCNPTSQYHNKKFKIAAEFFGLEVTRHPTKGWAVTNVSTIAQEAIDALKPEESVYNIFRVSGSKKDKAAPKYLAIFIDTSYTDKLDEACDKMGKNKKQVVENLLDTFLDEE